MNNIGKVIGLFAGMAVFIALMSLVLALRDYNIRMDGLTPTFVAKIQVSTPSSITTDSSEPKKLTIKCTNLGGSVDGYEFKVSRFKNMFLFHTYRSEMPKKELGRLKPGKTYYIQARAYKKNDKGRLVHGKWGGIHAATVKKEEQ